MFSDEMLSALTQKNITLVYFVELYYKSGTTRVHSHTSTLIVNDKEFFGVGNLGSITPIKASGELVATRVKLTLGGLDANLVKIALDEPTIGCPARIYLGILKDTQHVEPVELIFSGKIAKQDLVTGEQNQINLTLSNRFEEWQRPNPSRKNQASHKALHPDDNFYGFIDQVADRPIYWGSKKDAPAFIRK